MARSGNLIGASGIDIECFVGGLVLFVRHARIDGRSSKTTVITLDGAGGVLCSDNNRWVLGHVDRPCDHGRFKLDEPRTMDCQALCRSVTRGVCLVVGTVFDGRNPTQLLHRQFRLLIAGTAPAD